MNINEAIKTLDGVIPSSDNKMVDFEHSPIAIAWETVKDEIERLKKEVDYLEYETKEARKDMSEAVNEITKKIFKSFENAFSLYYPHGILAYEDFQNHFMYLAEKYGVEIPHGVKKGVKRIENRYF